ncbi:MAG: rod shape-determining protein MreD [Candidatus Moranbacteria bacterium CG23_combo_of_CG06-09_8_20_14_all_35_22]|nr:MAG: rod shape-determining protein MreD [Candidatus Moranbacteria bacterium CG23_combo_of_CG06-09_8_20_14_all_35_22]
MEQKIKIGLVIFFAVFLQISFFPRIAFQGIVPDIILVLIILWSFRKKFEDIWPWAIFSGIILDVAMLGKIGINTISFLILSFATSFLQERFFIAQRTGSFFIALAIVVGGTFLNELMISVLVDFSTKLFLENIILKIVVNVIVAVFLYWLIAKFKKFFGISESKLSVG